MMRSTACFNGFHEWIPFFNTDHQMWCRHCRTLAKRGPNDIVGPRERTSQEIDTTEDAARLIEEAAYEKAHDLAVVALAALEAHSAIEDNPAETPTVCLMADSDDGDDRSRRYGPPSGYITFGDPDGCH